MATEGINSKERVQAFGEVFTPDKTVNEMIEMVDKELRKQCIETWDYVEKTWLEPACGDGQFLVRLLDYKIKEVNKLSDEDREMGLVQALATIYGIDIQADNVVKARERMMQLLETGNVETYNIAGEETKPFTKVNVEITERLKEVLKNILETNIQCGDALKNERYKIKMYSTGNIGIQEGYKEELTVTEFEFDRKTKRVEAKEYYMKDIGGKAFKRYKPIQYNRLDKRKEIEGDIQTDTNF